MARIQIRRGTAMRWEDANRVLRDGEPGYDTTTNKMKVGDGITPWKDLPYVGEELVEAHIHDATPHPVYDDGPSLALLYENAKV